MENKRKFCMMTQQMKILYDDTPNKVETKKRKLTDDTPSKME